MAIHLGHQGHEVLKALSPAGRLANDDPAWLLGFFHGLEGCVESGHLHCIHAGQFVPSWVWF